MFKVDYINQYVYGRLYKYKCMVDYINISLW